MPVKGKQTSTIISYNVVQTHGHYVGQFCYFTNLPQAYCRTQIFLIQVDFAGDTFFGQQRANP